MKRSFLIPRVILAVTLLFAQLPSLIVLRLVRDIAKYRASTIVQNADGSYQMVSDSLQTLKFFFSYAWIWGVIALCLAAALAIPIIMGLRRGAPCIAVISVGTGITAAQAVLAALFAFVLPDVHEFDLHAFMFMRYDLSALYNRIPDAIALYAGQFLLIALGALFAACALLALSLTVIELALFVCARKKAAIAAN